MPQPDSNAADRLWTADEVAAFLGIHPQTVYAKARAGDIPSFKVGGARRFRRREIEEWIAAQAQGPAAAENASDDDSAFTTTPADGAKQRRAV